MDNREYTNISVDEVIDLHDAIPGITGGLLVGAVIEAAIARVPTAIAYSNVSLECAGWLIGESIVRNHPFVDGNKRTGLLSTILFWKRNCVYIPADQVWLAQKILQSANRNHFLIEP